MGKIVLLENPLDPFDRREFSHDGPFITFLEERFPNGFGGRPHICALNGDKLPVEDYDRSIGAKDQVILTIMPAFSAAVLAPIFGALLAPAVASALNGALVSLVLNFAINKFFGPKGSKPAEPARGGLPEASPTYSLSAPSNTARLGQPVPVAYGRNLIVPDIASQPYSWFSENDQFVCILLCLGQGVFDIHRILVGNTDASDLAPGVLSVAVFPPSVHAQTFGVIQAATYLHENVYTCPEVSDQELIAGSPEMSLAWVGAEVFWGSHAVTTQAGSPYYNDGTASEGGIVNVDSGIIFTSEETTTMEGNFFLLDGPNYELSEYYPGHDIWLTVRVEGHPDSYHKLEWFDSIYAGSRPPQYRSGHCGLENSWPVYGRCTIRFSLTNPALSEPAPGVAVGPYAVTTRGVLTTYLQYDITLPGGCYSQNQETGSIEPMHVSARFIAEPINDLGEVVGPGQRLDWAATYSTTSAIRVTLHHAVSTSGYRVTGYRTSAKSGKASDVSTLMWVGAKAILGNTGGGSVYGDVTLLTVTAKATQGLASDAISRISIDCTRVLPRGGAATRSPIDALDDIITNARYGGRRPDTEIDWPTFRDKKTAWAAAGKIFDAVFDTPVDLWSAMQAAVQVQHTSPTMLGSLITLVEDRLYTVPEYSFTEDNIKELSLTFLFPEGNASDGVEGEYRDPADNAQLFVLYPDDSVNPEKVVVWGCRDYSTALAYVTQRWNQLRLRRLLVTISTELDGRVLRVGAPVNVTHPKLGSSPVLCVINSIECGDEFSSTIHLHRHEPGVYV